MCSMPRELCVCGSLIQDELQISIFNDRRKWGKVVTVMAFDGNSNVDLQDFLKKAKRKVASGGTVRGNEVELMGDHRFRLKKLLMDEGVPEENIIIR